MLRKVWSTILWHTGRMPPDEDQLSLRQADQIRGDQIKVARRPPLPVALLLALLWIVGMWALVALTVGLDPG